MPEKPNKNHSKNRTDEISEAASHSKHGDGIDELELIPISPQLPGEKPADSIPPKQPAIVDPPTEDPDDEITLDKADDQQTPATPHATNRKKKTSNQRKSANRRYPSGKEVDLSSKSSVLPSTTEPATIQQEEPETPTLSDAPKTDAHPVSLALDDDPIPTEVSTQHHPNSEQSALADVQNSDPTITDAAITADAAPTSIPTKNLSTKKQLDSALVEKIALIVFFLVLVVGLAVYIPQMIPQGQLTNNVVDAADTPIELDDITIETLDARWTQTLHIPDRVRRNVEWTPELELAISGSGSGAFRILFLNQDGRQRGDTMDIAFADGKFQPSGNSSEKIYCTHGLASDLELKDLQARGDAWWTVRVLKGQNIKAPSSEFDTIIEMRIPFKIVLSNR